MATEYRLYVREINSDYTRIDETVLNVNLIQCMYKPSSLEIEIQTVSDINTFKDKLIKLSYRNNNGTTESDLFKDYFIFNIKKKGEKITLTAYSLDKFLTIDKFSQAFTGKLLVDEMIKPTLQTSNSTSFKNFRKILTKSETGDISNIIKNKIQNSIIPYAVQYNESFYDFMVRMCNRDGEFLFFDENQELHIGLDETVTNTNLELNTETEIIDSYFETDESNWVDPDYLGKLKDKGVDYKENFNSTAIKETSNLYSSCYVLAPEYLENIKEVERKDYAVLGDYMCWFSEVAASLRAFEENGAVSDSLVATAKYIADRVLHINHFKDGVNKDYENKFRYIYKKEGDETIKEERSYLYADEQRKKINYQEIYKGQQFSQSNQIIINISYVPPVKVGQVIKLSTGDDKYVVYNIENYIIGTKFGDDISYVEDYKILLIKFNGDTVYPLPIIENRFRKSSAQRAIVMDNFDPSRLGRVRVKFPWQKEKDTEQKNEDQINESNNWTPWIRVATPMASDGAGFLFTPAVNDEVLVDYEDGNIERPYVCGAFYNESNRPSIASQSQMHGKVKSITSANGHHISFTDNAGLERYVSNFMPIAKYVSSFGLCDEQSFKFDEAKYFGGGFEISDYFGIYSITGSTHNRSINVSSPFGSVSIDAFQGITINAPLGDVKIVGKNVSIEARNNLKLESGTNIKNCFGKYKNSGFQKTINEFASSLFADNLLGTITGMIDLSFFRNYVEVLLRPIGGTMLIKSNRYLRLEAGEGKAVPVKNLNNKGIGILRSFVNVEHKTPLQYAKEDALRAYSDLCSYRDNLNSILSKYRTICGRENHQDVKFFNGSTLKAYSDIIHDITEQDEVFKNSIKLISEELEECSKKIQILKIFDDKGYKDEVDRLWNRLKGNFNGEVSNLQIELNKRELVYNHLKRIVGKNEEMEKSLSFVQIQTYDDESVANSITVKNRGMEESEEAWYKVWGDKALDSVKKQLDVGGFMDLSDDKVWGTNDKGAILFSDDKKSFFRIQPDGTFAKGLIRNYKEEFLQLMKNVNNDQQ